MSGGVDGVAFDVADGDGVAVPYDFVHLNAAGGFGAGDGFGVEGVDGILNGVGVVAVVMRDEDFGDGEAVFVDVVGDAFVPFAEIDDHDFFGFGAAEEEGVDLDGIEAEVFKDHWIVPSRLAFSKLASPVAPVKSAWATLAFRKMAREMSALRKVACWKSAPPGRE